MLKADLNKNLMVPPGITDLLNKELFKWRFDSKVMTDKTLNKEILNEFITSSFEFG